LVEREWEKILVSDLTLEKKKKLSKGRRGEKSGTRLVSKEGKKREGTVG